jgi:hypothetical protein
VSLQPVFATENGIGKPTKVVKTTPGDGLGPRRQVASRAVKPVGLKQRNVLGSGYFFSSAILPGITFSGGLDPGGLIERMKAMIFQRSSEVLTLKPIGGIGACTVPY